MGRVIVVDDEADMRLAVRLILERQGHIVEEAASGEDACQRIQDAPPDLLLMDVRMPGQDGLETLEKIRVSNKTLPVIIMTGYGNPETEKEAYRKGANQYILKPFRNEQLLDAVFQVGVGQEQKNVPVLKHDFSSENRDSDHSSVVQHYVPFFRHLSNVLRHAKAIFLDRWHNPPLLFERDPSLEERISLRLSVITDPIKVIHHGLFDRDFEFSMEEPIEQEPIEAAYSPPVRTEAEPYRAASEREIQKRPDQDVEKVHEDLSHQIQSVSQSLQAEIERLAEQMRQQALSKTIIAPTPSPSGLLESPQEEFHRLLIELHTSWGQRLSAIDKDLTLNKHLLGEWHKTFPHLRQAVNRSNAA